MTKMIKAPSGEYMHPQDFVRRRRWAARPPPSSAEPTPPAPAQGASRILRTTGRLRGPKVAGVVPSR